MKLCAQKAVEEARERHLQMPEEKNGRIVTLTGADGKKYGGMTNKPVKEFKEFVEIASSADANVLEIGAAYGTPYLMETFKKESMGHYTACELVGDQLRILATRIEELDPSKLSNLTLIEGPFPHKEVIDHLQEGGYDAVLASSVFHFLTEEEVVEAFKQVHRLLKPGGKLFAKMMTPYNGLKNPEAQRKTVEEVQNYLVHKTRPLPGFVKNIRGKAYLKDSITEQELKDFGIATDIHGFEFDKEVMKVFLESENFLVEICDYTPMTLHPYALDGKELLVLRDGRRGNQESNGVSSHRRQSSTPFSLPPSAFLCAYSRTVIVSLFDDTMSMTEGDGTGVLPLADLADNRVFAVLFCVVFALLLLLLFALMCKVWGLRRAVVPSPYRVDGPSQIYLTPEV
uniref:Methyltransferase domain-containing protein n=1 Tax=Plectus sambesii TaxID=2011161 RepID=A0A914W3R1_9BILA